nr:MAG TPA: hypothetical protein [Caudoviricetes sp.]
MKRNSFKNRGDGVIGRRYIAVAVFAANPHGNIRIAKEVK